MAGTEPKWLIKSNGVIQGPFSTTDLEKKIRSRQAVLHDEVTQPDQPWLFIRDVVELRRVVDELQRGGRISSMENTATVTSTAFTQSVTDAASDQLDDLTPFSMTPPKTAPDSPKVVVEAPLKSNVPVEVRSYGVLDQQTIQRQAEQSTRWLQKMVLGTVFLVAGILVFNEVIKKPSVSQFTSTNEMTLAMTAIRLGDGTKALKHFEQASQNETGNVQAKIFYNLFLLHDQSSLSGQVLQSLSEIKKPEGKEREIKLVQSLALLYLRRFSDARRELKASQMIATTNPSIRGGDQIVTNMAIADFFEGKFAEVRAQLGQFEGQQGSGVKNVLLAISDMKRFLAGGPKELMRSASQGLGQFIRRAQNWKVEALILQAYAASMLEDKVGVEKSVDQLLESDPDLTALHWQDPWVAHELIKTEVFSEWCPKLVQRMNDSAQKNMLDGYCNLKAGREQAAQRAAEQALVKSPKDPLINAWYGIIYRDSGFEGKAGEHFAKADQYNEGLDENEKFTLPWVLQARWLEVGQDYQAASQLWNKVISRDADSLPALSGRARFMFETGNIKEAQEIAGRAKLLSPDYRPLLEITYDIEGKQKL